MATHTLTLEIPDKIYEELEQRAKQTHRPVEAELLEAADRGLNLNPKLSTYSNTLIEALKTLDDKTLWQAARSRFPKRSSTQLTKLNQKQDSLTTLEKQQVSDLLKQAEQVILVRAHAALLLKQRGFDVSELGPEA